MTSMKQLRKQLPDYKDLSDGELLMSLHRKLYPDMHVREFMDSIDGSENAHTTIKNPELLKYWRDNVVKPLGEESDADRSKRLGGSVDGPVGDPGGRRMAAARSYLQGGTLGYGSRVVAAGISASPNITYDQALQAEQDRLEIGRDRYPLQSMVMEGAGAIPTAMATGNAAGVTSAVTKGNLAKGGLLGGLEAFIYGTGDHRGGGIDRLKHGLKYTPIGVGAGVIAPPVAKAVSHAGRAVAAPFKGLLGSLTKAPNQTLANRKIAKAISQSGKSANDIIDDLARAADDGQPEFMLADALGNPGQRQVAGIARQPGDMRRPLVDMLEDRQLTQGDRLTMFLEDALDPGKTSRQTDDALRTARRAAANKLYGKASATARPVNPDGAISLIDDAISGWQNTAKGQGMKAPDITKTLIGLRRQLAGKTKAGEKTVLSDYDSILGIYRQLDDDISKAYKKGKGNLGEALKSVRKELEKALADSSDEFRAANAKYHADSKVIDKIDIGRKDAGRARLEDTAASRSALETPEQAAAYKSGYYDPMATKIQNSPVGTDKSRDLFKPKTAADLRAMAEDPELLARRLAREKTMFETKNAATGGSLTSSNQADQADVSPEDISMVMNILSNRLGAAATQGGARAAQVLSGGGAATRDFIAKALMSKDGQVISAAMRQATTDAQRQALLTQLFRSTVRSTGSNQPKPRRARP